MSLPEAGTQVAIPGTHAVPEPTNPTLGALRDPQAIPPWCGSQTADPRYHPPKEPQVTTETDFRDRITALSGTRDYADLPHSCCCGSRWSGIGTCHCGACHLTFTGVQAFDWHRRGGICAEPAATGMVLAVGRAYEAWSDPRDGVAG